MSAGHVACSNCGAHLHGPFCHQCGQSTAERPYDLRAFFVSALHDVFSFRSRSLRSLVLLAVKPGEVTADYFAGRRVRHTQPVQLYLIAAALFFLANSFHPFIAVTGQNQVMSSLGSIRAGRVLSTEDLRALQTNGVSMEVFRERFRSAVNQSLPPFMIGSIVGFAMALSAFSPRRPALVHIVFSLHWTAFYLAIMAFERFVPGPPGQTSILGPIFVVLAIGHLIVALRRVYHHSWPRAIASGLGLTVLFNLLLAGWVLSVVAYAQWLVVR